MVDALTRIAANVDSGELASGHQSVTGTATIEVPLSGVVKSCGANLAAPVVGAGNPWVVGCVATSNPGEITVTVKDSAGTQSTAAAVVHWWASDAE